MIYLGATTLGDIMENKELSAFEKSVRTSEILSRVPEKQGDVIDASVLFYEKQLAVEIANGLGAIRGIK